MSRQSRRRRDEDYYDEYDDEIYQDDYDDEYDERPRRRRSRRRSRRGCWIALIVLALLATCAGAIAAVLVFLASEPNEITVEVTSPRQLAFAAGSADTAAITLLIENDSLDAVTISAVGLDQSLLDGVAVSAIYVKDTPDPVNPDTDRPIRLSAKSRDFPLVGELEEYKLNQDMANGQKLYITLVVQPRPDPAAAGSYEGDVTIWVENEVLGLSLSRAWRETVTIQIG